MQAQTYVGMVEWVIVDDGSAPWRPRFAREGWELVHLIRPFTEPGIHSFTGNILRGIEAARGDRVLIIEDDDYYAPTHISEVATRLHGAAIVGHKRQRYYHLPSRQWMACKNVGSSLCQTGIRRELLPVLREACETARAKDSRGVDSFLWRAAKVGSWPRDNYDGESTVVGMKGIVGRPGLGIGHRPDQHPGFNWQHDPEGAQLREWLGSDAEEYLGDPD